MRRSIVSRQIFDCRELPGDCTLSISGTLEEVMEAQVQHAVSVHGQEDGPGLRDLIASYLKEEQPA